MSTTPKALELAAALTNYVNKYGTEDGGMFLMIEAINELRRQHEEIEGLRAQVEALSKELADANDTADWHKRRTSLLQQLQRTMQEPERTIVCDVLANGHLLQGPDGRPDKQRYAPPQTPTRPAVPEGWKLVPVEPTEDMLDAAHESDREYTLRNFGDVMTVMQGPWDHWDAMVNAAPQPDQVTPFQNRVQPWLMECFGEMIAGDREERNHRFLEEALELVQACGCTASEAHQLVDYTFGRPIGEPAQEVGGVMVTLAALCLANRLDMHANGETELTRINAPEMVKKIRAKQVAKPKYSPLPEAAPQPEAAQPEPATTAPCKGMNCGCTDGLSHSMECQAEHAAAIAGGWFIKDAAVRAVGDA